MLRSTRYQIDLTQGLLLRLLAISQYNGDSLELTMRKAMALYVLCHDAARAGKKVGIAADDGTLEIEFTGL